MRGKGEEGGGGHVDLQVNILRNIHINEQCSKYQAPQAHRVPSCQCGNGEWRPVRLPDQQDVGESKVVY